MAANIYQEAMEALHDHSIPTIELLQSGFPDKKQFMINISTLFDPRYVFLIGAPILFAINKSVGHRTILALAITEWMNQVLKWLLAGHRPYWYVHERAIELSNGSLSTAQPQLQPTGNLKQFPVTCELGAGSPSGHSMVTATVLYVIIDAFLKGELGVEPAEVYRRQAAKLGWSLYLAALIAVGLSRVYLACHFPHQCLCGAICGFLVAKLVSEKMPMKKLKTSHFALGTGFMFVSVMSVYAVLIATGFDPLWSVQKGLRWCVKKEYIHMDTTPFFSMMRYLGFALGPGLAYNYTCRQQSRRTLRKRTNSDELDSNDSLLIGSQVLAAILSIFFGQLLISLPIPRANMTLFYFVSFLTYTLFSYTISSPIPNFSRWLLSVDDENQASKSKRY